MNIEKMIAAFVFVGFAVAIVACQPATPPPPTVTPTITVTATITATPTKTPLPANVLTASSCENIETMARIGQGKITKMRYTADGTQLLVASSGGLELYDTKEFKLLWNAITQVSIADFGVDVEAQTIIAIDKKDTIHQLDLKTGKLINSAPQGDGGKWMGIAVAPDGKTVATGTFDGEIYQYDTEHFDQKGPVIKGPGTFSDAMFGDMVYFDLGYSPDGKYLLFATLRTEIFVYDAASGKLVRKVAPLNPDYDNRIFPEQIAVSNNGKMMGIQYANGQTLVVPTTGSQKGNLIEGSAPSLSPDGSIVALKTAKGLELFQTSTGKSLNSLPNTEKAFGDAIFSPDGKTLGVVMPEKTVFWDTKQLTELQTIETGFTDYQAMALSQDGKTLAAGSPAQLEFYQLKDGKRSPFMLDHPAELMNFADNDSTLVIAGATWLSTFDMQQHKISKQIELSGNVENMDVSPDGKTAVLIIKDSAILLYDLSSGTSQSIGETTQKIVSVRFLNNTDILALDNDDNVLLSTSEKRAFSKSLSGASANGNPLIAFSVGINGGPISIYDITKQVIVKSPLEKQSVMWAISPVNNIVAMPDTFSKTLTLVDIHLASSSCEAKDFQIEPKRMLFSNDGQYLFINGRNGMIYMLATFASDNPNGY